MLQQNEKSTQMNNFWVVHKNTEIKREAVY